MKKLKLKRWVKVCLWLILLFVFCSAIYHDYKKEVITETPVGEYSCRGTIIQLCSGSKEVKDYLG